MSLPRKKSKRNLNKNNQTSKRLNRCSEQHSKACAENKDIKYHKKNAPRTLTQKDVTNILLDLSMKALYNEGDKRELNLVEEILKPHRIEFHDEKSLESYWDIITNSGFIKPSIGFGNNGKVSLSKAGFDVMSQFGSYMDFLQTQNAQKNIIIGSPVEVITPIEENEEENDVEDTDTES